MARKKIRVEKATLEHALSASRFATAAAESLGMKYSTFKRRCEEHGVVMVTDQGRRGVLGRQHRGDRTIPLDAILANQVPCKTTVLKKKLLSSGFIEEKCAACGTGPIWNGQPLTLQLDHANGDSSDNSAANLRLLCPNCHTQTPTWGRKKRITRL